MSGALPPNCWKSPTQTNGADYKGTQAKDIALRNIFVQIPETSSYNPYIGSQARALAKQGYDEILLSLCCDEPGFRIARTLPSLEFIKGCSIRVLHIHWAEKLVEKTHLVDLLKFFRSQGFIIVRTHHNFLPRYYDQQLLQLVHGHHFFSNLQRRTAEKIFRYRFPNTLIFSHPYFAFDQASAQSNQRQAFRVGRSFENKIVIGCFGFIEPYKRTLEFARSFTDFGSNRLALVIAGLPGTVAVDHELRKLASQFPEIKYCGRFLEHTAFLDAMQSVDYVILPYSHLWSSGIFVLASQLGITAISPLPFMLDLNKHDSNTGRIFLRPWSDLQAIKWLHTSGIKRNREVPATPTGFPSWDSVSSSLDDFYKRLNHLL